MEENARITETAGFFKMLATIYQTNLKLQQTVSKGIRYVQRHDWPQLHSGRKQNWIPTYRLHRIQNYQYLKPATEAGPAVMLDIYFQQTLT
jgi:hypothetical protein